MTRKKHINKFLAPTQSRDYPSNLFTFVFFFFSTLRLQVVNFTLPGLRVHTLQTRAFSSFASHTLALPRSSPGLARSSPGLARSSPVPCPFLARSSPVPRPASPVPRPASPGPHPTPPTIASSNLAVKTGKRESY